MIIEHVRHARFKKGIKEKPEIVWKGYLLKSPVTMRVIRAFSSEAEAKSYRLKLRQDPHRAWMVPG